MWKSRICPRFVVTQESLEWLGLFQHYRSGHLAFRGGALDQPAYYMKAMLAITKALNTL